MTASGPRAPAGVSADPLARAVRNATALGVSTLAANGLLFGWQLVLARWLGPTDYGVYGTIGALLAVAAAVPECGMGLVVVRDVAVRPADAGRYLGATLAVQPLLAVAAYAGVRGAARLLGYDAGLRALLVLAAASLLIGALGNMGHNQLLAAERMVPPALIAVAHAALLVGLAATALALGTGLWGLYAATLLAGLGRAGAYWTLLGTMGCRPVLPPDRAVVSGLLAGGLPLAATSLLALTYVHADKLVTTALLGPAATGFLTAGFVIAFGLIELLSTTVLVAVLPWMARTHAAGDRDALHGTLEALVVFAVAAGTPVAIAASLLAAPLAGGVFGAAFARTADVLRVLMWYIVLAMVVNVFAQALTVQNRQGRLLAVRASGLALNVGLALVLLPALGPAGAAVAMLASEAAVLGWVSRAFPLGVEWWARVADRVWRLGLAASAQSAILLALRARHPVAAVGAGVAAYVVLAAVAGALPRGDRERLGRLLVAVPGIDALRRRFA